MVVADYEAFTKYDDFKTNIQHVPFMLLAKGLNINDHKDEKGDRIKKFKDINELINHYTS